MSSAKGSVSVDDTPEASGFLDKIGPGGPYFLYSEIVILVLALAFLTILVMILLPYFGGSKYQNSISLHFGVVPIATPIGTPKPTPGVRKFYPLPSGSQSWNFSYGPDTTGPEVQSATVDPLTPDKGATQTITITTAHDPSLKVTATEVTDNGPHSYSMKLTGSTATLDTYSVSFQMPDTYNETYHINFSLQSSSGSGSGALSFR